MNHCSLCSRPVHVANYNRLREVHYCKACRPEARREQQRLRRERARKEKA